MSRRALLASTAALVVAGTTALRARTLAGSTPWEPGTAAPPIPVRQGPYLKSGTNSWTLASGPMADAVSHSTSKMTDEDIAAIATYLKDGDTGESAATPVAIAANDNAMRAGAAIYKDACAVCHKDAGTGEVHLFPRLAGSALVQSDDPTTLARVVLQGTRAVATSDAPTAPAMPAFDWRLDDGQVAAVLTYIRNSWGNAASAVLASAIANSREALAKAP